MAKSSSATRVEQLSDGRFAISAASLRSLMSNPRRVKTIALLGRLETLVFLDRPYVVTGRVRGAAGERRTLRTLRLRELPGWPPTLVPGVSPLRLGPLAESRFLLAKYRRRRGIGGDVLELHLTHRGRTEVAWMVGCPEPLLRCAEATLNQEEAKGMPLLSLQDMRLICG